MPPALRPLVHRHPGSGRKTLYLASHAMHIHGWSVPEGRVLLNDLIEFATQQRFVHRHVWRRGDLVMAMQWYRKAISLGDHRAEARLKLLSGKPAG